MIQTCFGLRVSSFHRRCTGSTLAFADLHLRSPNCAPARASLLSGQYTPRHQIYNVGTGPRGNSRYRRLLHIPGEDTLDPKITTWALYLSHFAVHTPLDAKREQVAKYRAKPPGKLHRHVDMATMIEAVDLGIGRLAVALDRLRLTAKTVVFFYSDNGGYGPATDMHPLKGYKGTYYEGGIRVPLVVKWPEVVEPGSHCSVPVTGVDLYPTLCEIAGASLPQQQILDGVSLVPLLKGAQSLPGNADGDRALYWHFPAYLESYALNDEQRDPLFRSRPCSVIRLGPWKLHQYFEEGLTPGASGIELYNLLGDPGERVDLSERLPQKAQELLERLEAWRRQLNAPMPTVPNPEFDAEAEAAAIAARRR